MLSLCPRRWMRVALGSGGSDLIAFSIALVTLPRSRPLTFACTSTTRCTET